MLLTKEQYKAIRRTPGYGFYLQDYKAVSTLTIKQVQEAIETVFGDQLPEYWLKIKTRDQWITKPRQLAHYFAFRFTPARLADIGLYFGRRDRSTVYASTRLVEDVILANKKDVYYGKVMEIFAILNKIESSEKQ